MALHSYPSVLPAHLRSHFAKPSSNTSTSQATCQPCVWRGQQVSSRNIRSRTADRSALRKIVCSAQDGDTTSGKEDEGESVSDVVARLAAAEAEAAALRDALEAAQGGAGGTEDLAGLTQDQLAKRKPATPDQRIDGMGYRETIFSGPGPSEDGDSGWLRESDLAFFTGNGATEGGGPGMTEEEQATVNRRLIGGLLFTAAAGAFALVPDRKVRPRPSKPLFFYLVPLLRIQALMPQLERAAEAGQFTELRDILKNITKDPNNAKQNMNSAAAYLDNDADYNKAEALILEFMEYISQVDFKNYFDNVGQVSVAQEMQFKDFSLNCSKAARKKLDEFLRLMPEEQLGAAQSQLSVFQ